MAPHPPPGPVVRLRGPILAALGLAALLALPALALPGPLAGPVGMSSLTGFNPPVVAVAAGGGVTWVNDDPAAIGHTVTSLTGDFDSGFLGAGQAYTVAFPAAGAFPYACQYHPWMVGVVVVA